MSRLMRHSAGFAKRPRPARRGFTLVELVVSITVGAIISGVAGMLILNAAKQRTEVSARCELNDMGAAAMEVMLRHIREIAQDECSGGSTPCLNGNAQVSTATAADLRFGTTGFRLSGTELQMTSDSGSNWYTLATGVSCLTFAYYDRTNAVLSPLPLNATRREDIRRVSIDLRMSNGGQTARLKTSIFLRNFMNEVMNAP